MVFVWVLGRFLFIGEGRGVNIDGTEKRNGSRI